jgi:pimeloyl-ACP methyl ester carboxylesterase
MRVTWIAALLPVIACGGKASGPAPTPVAAVESIAGPWGDLRIDDGGAGGVPVVFVHGLAADHHVWDKALAHERKTRRALAFDLHGHGESAPSSTGDYSMESFAADVAAVVDARGVERFVLVGHSMGGDVVVAYAGLHPERIAGLVLVDAPGDLSGVPPAALEELAAGFAEESYADFSVKFYGEMLIDAAPGVTEQVLGGLRATPREVFVPSFEGMFGFDPKPALAKYTGPKLALVKKDNDDATALHNLPPGFDHEVVEGVSHWLMMDKPEWFAAALDTFIAEQVSGSR